MSNPSAEQSWNVDALSLFRKTLPPEFFEHVRQEANIRENNRVYTLPVVMWLMITQRLGGNGALESGVLELMRALPGSFWPEPCKTAAGLAKQSIVIV